MAWINRIAYLMFRYQRFSIPPSHTNIPLLLPSHPHLPATPTCLNLVAFL